MIDEDRRRIASSGCRVFIEVHVTGRHCAQRDLTAEHGEDYLAYRRKVRGFVPLPRVR